MFSFIKEFINEHKKKFIVFGVVIGGAVIGTKYAQYKLVDWQEKETKDFLEKTRKQHYFESSEKTCNQTILVLSATLRENILELIDCDSIIKQLRDGATNKVDLWHELKVLSFTKVSLLIYSGTLLVIALRIQLNIIGGYIYSKTNVPNSCLNLTNHFQEEYLSKCYYFLKDGVTELLPLVKEKVCLSLRDVSLKQSLSLQQVESIFWAVQCAINEDSRSPLRNMAKFLYGPNYLEEQDTFIKETMLDTADLLQSVEVIDISTSCVSRGYSNLMDKIAEFFYPQECDSVSSLSAKNKGASSDLFKHPNSFSKPLAKIIPIINGFGNPGTFDVPEAWINPFIYMDGLKMLGANIYESFSEVKFVNK